MRLGILGLALLLVAASLRADEWRRFTGPGGVVEAAPRYAGFAANLARDIPVRSQEVRKTLGLAPPARIRVTVGRDAAHLASRLGVPLRPWVAGVAIKGEAWIGLNATSLGPPASMPAAVILRHELTHLALGERLGSGRAIPLWLEEGICQWVAGTAYLGQRSDLVGRLSFDDLIAWEAIARQFPADRPRATLAYLQSFAFVDYLATTRGDRFPLELVDVVARGAPVHRALLELTGQAQVDLEKAWMHYERQRSRRLLYLLQGLSPLVIGAVLLVLAWRRRVHVARFLLERMEEEESTLAAEGPRLEISPVPLAPARNPHAT